MDFPWGRILPLIGMVFLQVLSEPFFWIVVLLVGIQYWRMLKVKEALFGLKDSVLRVSTASLIYGLLGGLVGSILMVFFGITMNGLGIGYLWLLALALMLINPRFLCFSYSGGILALFSLVTGRPQVNVPALMGLVAVLHLVESILILASGHFNPVPVYVRDPSGRVVGAFNLQKFWPIPLAIMTVLIGLPQHVPGDIIKMPEWWPLILPWETVKSQEIVYGIFPVVAALGYGELAVTCLPREKARLSSINLAVFSCILLALAVLASHFSKLSILAAFFSPIGHELVIYLGRRKEFSGKPRFVPPSRGVKVLDVIKGSPAERGRIRAGDIILSIEGIQVNSRAELARALDYFAPAIYLELADSHGTKTVRITYERGAPFGVIPVPEPGDPPNVDYSLSSPLKNLALRFFKRRI